MLIPGGPSGAGSSPRVARRAEPRFVIMLAAAGAAVAAAGPVIIGEDQSDAMAIGQSNLLGALLAMATVAVGYFLLARIRSGPLATAGSIAVVVGVPPAMFFLTSDAGSVAIEAILWVSAAAYLATWAVGPARGRPVFLGAGLLALWLFVREVLDPVVGGVQDAVSPFPTTPDMPVPGGSEFDPTLSGLISLGFGAAYLVLARHWDREGARGAAVAPAAAGLIAVATGVSWVAQDFEPSATGFLLMMIGIAVATNGANTGRRATTWLGAYSVALGAGVIVGDTLGTVTASGVGFVIVGTVIVAAASVGQTAVAEADEVEQATDRLRTRPEPRLMTTMGSAGGVLVAAGATTIGLDAVFSTDGNSSQIPGIVASVALVAVGYYLLWRTGHGPRSSAGSVAAVTGVPALVFFITVDLEASTPFSVVGLLAVSVVAWLPTWFWSKRPVYLGAGVFAVWLLLLELVEDALSFLLSGDVLFGLLFGFFSDDGPTDVPDPTVLGVLSFVVAGGCVALAVWWDRRRHLGAVTPLIAPIVVCFAAGVLFLSDDLEQSGSGVVLAAIGCGLALAGSRMGRRGLAWSGVLGMVQGVSFVIDDVTSSATSSGLVALLIGTAMVLAAHGLSLQTGEPDEMQRADRSDESGERVVSPGEPPTPSAEL